MSSLSAMLRALPEGLTLKPIIIASDAEANRTSDSVMAPTALWTILTCISSVDNFSNESDKASTEPSTSPFKMIFNSLNSPNAIRLPISSRVKCFWVLTLCSLTSCVLLDAICLASFSSANTLNLSPACGAPSKPNTETGIDGPAELIWLPLSSYNALTFPLYWPAKK